jgi:tRNA pseudouridine38-40 synthase
LLSGLQRWAAGVEYRGTAYSGWQIQDDAPSVQQAVEKGLSSVANHPLHVVCAGRTDAGVHALGQVIHFDSEARRSAHAWLLGVNSQLPRDIALSWVQPADLKFSARYSALSRRYRYVLRSGRARSGLLHDGAGRVIGKLDEGAMHRAAQALVGTHDFSAYRDSDCQSPSPVRTLQALSVRRHQEFVVIDVKANAFLHHMVRNITGVLIAIGEGEQPESWAQAVLDSRQRAKGGVTAEARGLYFIGPEYPPEFGIPAPPEPWFPGSIA